MEKTLSYPDNYEDLSEEELAGVSKSFNIPSENNFLDVCDADADRLLIEVGMQPYSAVWIKKEFKEKRVLIINQLVALRDEGGEDAYRNSYTIAFFLNARFLLRQSNKLKDLNSSDDKNARMSAFNSFYMEGMKAWGGYDPSKSSFTCYMCNLGHKVRSQSKEIPDEFDSNRMYMFNSLSKFEQLIREDYYKSGVRITLSELKTQLHNKSGKSMTNIDMYFKWKAQKPVSIENYRTGENGEKAEYNLAVSEEEKSGKSHLRTTEDLASEHEFFNSLLGRLDEMMSDGAISFSDGPVKIKEFLKLLAISNATPRKIAEDLGMDKQTWPKLKKKILMDDEMCRIFNLPKHHETKVYHKSAEISKIDVDLFSDEEDVVTEEIPLQLH